MFSFQLINLPRAIFATQTTMDFYDQEALNGARFTWNVLPANKVGAARLEVPVGCMYTPLKEIGSLPLV